MAEVIGAPACSGRRTSRSPSSGSAGLRSASCSCRSPSTTPARRSTAAWDAGYPLLRHRAVVRPGAVRAAHRQPALRDHPRERLRAVHQGRTLAPTRQRRWLRAARRGSVARRTRSSSTTRTTGSCARSSRAGCGWVSPASTSRSSTTWTGCTSTMPTFDAHFRDLAGSGWQALDELRSSGQIRAVGAGINDARAHPALPGHRRHRRIPGRHAVHPAQSGGPRRRVPGGDGARGRLRHRRRLPVGHPGHRGRSRVRRTTTRQRRPRSWRRVRRIAGRLRAARRAARRGRPAVPARATRPSRRSSRAPSIPTRSGRNVEAFAQSIPADLWAELKHEGLLRTDAPVPDAPVPA